MKEDVLSKKINIWILLVSVLYTFLFTANQWIGTAIPLLTDGLHQNNEIIKNSLISYPGTFFFFYIFIGLPILLVGWIIKRIYRKKLDELYPLKNIKTIVILIILTGLWIKYSQTIWNIFNNLRLG